MAIFPTKWRANEQLNGGWAPARIDFDFEEFGRFQGQFFLTCIEQRRNLQSFLLVWRWEVQSLHKFAEIVLYVVADNLSDFMFDDVWCASHGRHSLLVK